MILYAKGNILHDQSDAIVNTVNTVGVMGKGLALQFKKAFPDNFKAYKNACDKKELVTGQMLTTPTLSMNPPYYIINFPTKAHWKGNSKIEYIQEGLKALKKEVQRLELTSVAIPALGSGLGGLQWSEVEQEIKSELADMPEIEWRIYAPQDAPKAESMVNKTNRPRMTIGRAAVIGLINEYLTSGLDYKLSVLEVQKLVYFLTAAGEHLNKVQFQKHLYGPYADVLRHVLERMEGHFIYGYADGVIKPETALQLKEGAISDAQSFLETHPDTKKHFDEVTKLVSGFESPYGMELLSTVHWVATQECSNEEISPETIIEKVHAWSERKARMKPAHIKAALQRLQEERWLNKVAAV